MHPVRPLKHLPLLAASLGTLLLLGAYAQERQRLRRLLQRDIPPVPGDPSGDPSGDLPLVSVLIPARNEERCIVRCLESVLHQTYPHYEVIVVDDGSTDATPALLACAAHRHPRLRVLRNETLPVGWTGKNYACWRAVAAAQGEWLLFLDADTAASPHLLASIMVAARQQQVDLLSLFPLLEMETFWEQLFLPAFRAMIYAAFPLERVNAPDALPHEVVANGQCLLVRRDWYAAIGGHAAVRNAVLEDVSLGQRLRASGGSVGAAPGLHLIRVRMYTSRQEVLEGLTKNAFAGFRSAGPWAAWRGTRQFGLALGPFWLLLFGGGLTVRRHPAALAVLAQGALTLLVGLHHWATIARQLYQRPSTAALVWPAGLLGYGYITFRSVWLVWRRRGVRWKGRQYGG